MPNHDNSRELVLRCRVKRSTDELMVRSFALHGHCWKGTPMRKRLATAVLAMAVSGLVGFSSQSIFAQSARENPRAAPPAGEAGQDKEHAQIPVKQVVLYSSGVG